MMACIRIFASVSTKSVPTPPSTSPEPQRQQSATHTTTANSVSNFIQFGCTLSGQPINANFSLFHPLRQYNSSHNRIGLGQTFWWRLNFYGCRTPTPGSIRKSPQATTRQQQYPQRMLLASSGFTLPDRRHQQTAPAGEGSRHFFVHTF